MNQQPSATSRPSILTHRATYHSQYMAGSVWWVLLFSTPALQWLHITRPEMPACHEQHGSVLQIITQQTANQEHWYIKKVNTTISGIRAERQKSFFQREIKSFQRSQQHWHLGRLNEPGDYSGQVIEDQAFPFHQSCSVRTYICYLRIVMCSASSGKNVQLKRGGAT